MSNTNEETKTETGGDVLRCFHRLVVHFVAFILIWIPFCVIADFVLKLDGRVYNMCLGFVAGTMAMDFANYMRRKIT